MQGSTFSAPPAVGYFRYLLALLIAVNVALAIATGFGPHFPGIPTTQWLSLATEHTFGVWWSTVTLMLASVLLIANASVATRHALGQWLIAALLLGLSLDELGSIHERVYQDGWEDYLPYGVAGATVYLFAFALLWRDRTLRAHLVLMTAGFACFGSVVLQEYFEHNLDWPAWLLGLRVAVEEGIELLGTTLCLIAAYRLARADEPLAVASESERGGDALGAFVPRVVAIVAFGVHLVAVFMLPSLDGFPNQGNPAKWFPVIGWAMVATAALSTAATRREIALPFVVVGVIALLASAVHAPFQYPGGSTAKLLTVNASAFLAIVLTLALGLRVASRAGAWWALGLLPACAVALSVEGPSVAQLHFALVGLLALAALHTMDRYTRRLGRWQASTGSTPTHGSSACDAMGCDTTGTEIETAFRTALLGR